MTTDNDIQQLLNDEENNLKSHDKINRETARLLWSDLAPHFALGNLISISSELDLITAAQAMANDDTTLIQEWMNAGHLMRTSDEQAIQWNEDNTALWAVVIKPWVLVQK